MILRQTPSLVLIAVVLAAPAARAQLNQNPWPTPTASNMKVIAKGAVAAIPPGVADRIKTNGLLATDPQLKAKMAALLESRGRARGNRGSVVAQIVQGRGGYGEKNKPTAPPDTKGRKTAPPSGPPTLEITSAFLSAWDVDATLKVKAPKAYAAGEVTYKVSGPCGLDYGGPLESDGPLGICCFPDENGAEKMFLKNSSNNADKWRLGADGKTVTLTFLAAGLPNASKTFAGVLGAGQQVKITLSIDAVAPFLGANAAGLQAANAKFGGNSPRSSDGEPWVSTSGEDTLGLGVFLGKGYKVTETKIVAAQSKLDAPGNTAPENAYRYARVKTKPDADRLQTVVEWMYGPGESLSYTIEWTIVGPLGQRPLLTMPTSGPCDS
ncbi:MAG: hypothetical protein IPL89_06105 [Acidobacteria bacterium]|nr:hypothetical protein [Acidobacteriota bacterium]